MDERRRPPKDIRSITYRSVMEFYQTCSMEEKEWIKERLRHWINELGKKRYFASFRSEYAKHFWPEKFDIEKSYYKPQRSLLDMLVDWDEESTTK